jgi:hypothetical protein
LETNESSSTPAAIPERFGQTDGNLFVQLRARQGVDLKALTSEKTMKQIVVLASLALLAVGAVSVYLIFESEPPPKPIAPPAPPSVGDSKKESGADVAKEIETLLKQGGGTVVVSDGKKVVATPGLTMPTIEGVSSTNGVSVKDGKALLSATIVVQKETPTLVSKEAYDKIELGMAYQQIGAVLGDLFEKATLASDYSGRLTISQGSRTIDLGFEKGKLANKTSHGL